MYSKGHRLPGAALTHLAIKRPFTLKYSPIDFSFGLAGCRTELTTILWMGLAAGLLALFTPIVTGIIFDRLIPGAERGQIMQMSAILAVISLARAKPESLSFGNGR